MRRIDAHQHFWHYEPVKDAWMNEDMDRIRRDFTPEDLQPVLTKLDFDGSVLVQVAQTDAETEYLLKLAGENNFIRGVVGWVDLKADKIQKKLEMLSTYEKLKGFRHVLQTEPDDMYMLDHKFKRGIKALKEFGFTYDILIYPWHLKHATLLVSLFPEQSFVIDHLAKPFIKVRRIKEWENDIRQIAQHTNVFCKVSGMVTEADIHNWRPADLTPYLDVIFDAFSPERLMFGSDWPVCLIAASYEQWFNLVETYTDNNLTIEQSRAFWGENAIKFYNL
jgi:L-fuconolactonase